MTSAINKILTKFSLFL